MKIDMKTRNYKLLESGYNPRIQLGSNSFSTKVFHENSAVKNTTADRMKNKSILFSNEIGKS